jgi:anthranilate phosphoribosyltransferase
MRAFAAFVPTAGEDLLDTAGTGGGRRTFNVSTTAALIAAGAGCMVAKHGSRSSTGLSGSADVLEALGAKIDLDAAGVGRCIEEIGFGFMFAPYHHPATRHVVEVRKQLKVRTTFNFLGPLTNPAGANRQLLGVSDPATLPKMAGALALLGTRHAMLVCGEDSLDELSISAATRVIEIEDGSLKEYSVTPEELGLPRYGAEDVPGGDPVENAETARRIFAGEPGASRDLAVLNAGAAIYTGGAADSLAHGVLRAQEAIDSGAATAKLAAFVELTQKLSSQLTAST